MPLFGITLKYELVKKTVYWKRWQSKGINTISNLYDNGILMCYTEIVKKYGCNAKGDFWKFLQIRHCVAGKFTIEDSNPITAYLNKEHEVHKASLFYRTFNQFNSDLCENLKIIWQKDLGCNIDENALEEILSSVGRNIREVKGKFIQYKSLHITHYWTPSRLYRMGIAADDLCWKCHVETGTFFHMIWECPVIYSFWGQILNVMADWLEQILPT